MEQEGAKAQQQKPTQKKQAAPQEEEEEELPDLEDKGVQKATAMIQGAYLKRKRKPTTKASSEKETPKESTRPATDTTSDQGLLSSQNLQQS